MTREIRKRIELRGSSRTSNTTIYFLGFRCEKTGTRPAYSSNSRGLYVATRGRRISCVHIIASYGGAARLSPRYNRVVQRPIQQYFLRGSMCLIRVLLKYLNCMEAHTYSNKAKRIAEEDARLFPSTARSYRSLGNSGLPQRLQESVPDTIGWYKVRGYR